MMCPCGDPTTVQERESEAEEENQERGIYWAGFHCWQLTGMLSRSIGRPPSTARLVREIGVFAGSRPPLEEGISRRTNSPALRAAHVCRPTGACGLADARGRRAEGSMAGV